MDEQGAIIFGMVIVAELRARGRDDLIQRIAKDPDYTSKVSAAALYGARAAGRLNKDVLRGIVDSIIEDDEGVRRSH